MVKVIFPEGDDSRVQAAAKMLVDQGTCEPVLLSDTLASDSYPVVACDPSVSAVWQAGTMVATGEVDAVIAGAVFSTSEVLRAYLKTIGTEPGISRVTSCFLMEKGSERYLFADCGVQIDPNPEQLAEIAHLVAQFAPKVDIDPKIAFLSFSTHGSAEHDVVSKTQEVVRITKERWPELIVDGELQVDAAIVPAIASAKAPNSLLAGQATILVFPDLQSGNIGYKLVERLGGFSATGPLLLGFNKPAHDLSRGCSAVDIVKAAEIAVQQRQ